MLSPDGSSAKGYLDGSRTVQAVEWLAALIKNDVTAVYTDQWNNGYGYANDFQVRAGMSVGYYYKLPEYLKIMGPDLGVAPLPRFAGGVYSNVMFTWGHGIRPDTSHLEIAWEFLRELYVTDQDLRQAWAKTDLLAMKSGVRSLGQDKDSLLAVFINEFERSSYPVTLLNRRWSGSDLKLKLINPELRRIISSGENIQAGMSRLAEKIDDAFAEDYGNSR